MAKAKLAEVESLDFEQALAEMESIAQQMEEARQPLEESVTQYERAQALLARCKALLTGFEGRIAQMQDGEEKPLPKEDA